MGAGRRSRRPPSRNATGQPPRKPRRTKAVVDFNAAIPGICLDYDLDASIELQRIAGLGSWLGRPQDPCKCDPKPAQPNEKGEQRDLFLDK